MNSSFLRYNIFSSSLDKAHFGLINTCSPNSYGFGKKDAASKESLQKTDNLVLGGINRNGDNFIAMKPDGKCSSWVQL